MIEYGNILSGVYQHYKSTPENRKLYLVLSIGRHTETDEIVVIYVPLYVNSGQTGPRVQVRPASMFCDMVDFDGETVPRFKWLGVDIDSKHENAWTLEGYDTFDSSSYPLEGSYLTELDAKRAAQERLAALEAAQPSESSGGQDEHGIQDQVFIVCPDGSKYRFSG